MNPFEMVVAIIVVVTIGGVLKARYGVHKDAGASETFQERAEPGTAAESQRLRDEVRTLKERVQVLEQIVTDNEGRLRLDREIESLRDKR
jgi:hypothetical protein